MEALDLFATENDPTLVAGTDSARLISDQSRLEFQAVALDPS